MYVQYAKFANCTLNPLYLFLIAAACSVFYLLLKGCVKCFPTELDGDGIHVLTLCFLSFFSCRGGPGSRLFVAWLFLALRAPPRLAPAGPALSAIGFQLRRRRGSALSPSLRPVCFSICVGKEGCWAFKDPAHLSGLRGWQGPDRSGEPVLDHDGVRPPGQVHPTGQGWGGIIQSREGARTALWLQAVRVCELARG